LIQFKENLNSNWEISNDLNISK